MHNRLDWGREDYPGTKSRKRMCAKRQQGTIVSGKVKGRTEGEKQQVVQVQNPYSKKNRQKVEGKSK